MGRELWDKDGGTFELAPAKVGKRIVSLIEWVRRCFRDDTHLRRQSQEINSVLTRKIGDRKDLSLLPQFLIGNDRFCHRLKLPRLLRPVQLQPGGSVAGTFRRATPILSSAIP
jgi:hypothetical protein